MKSKWEAQKRRPHAKDCRVLIVLVDELKFHCVLLAADGVLARNANVHLSQLEERIRQRSVSTSSELVDDRVCERDLSQVFWGINAKKKKKKKDFCRCF